VPLDDKAKDRLRRIQLTDEQKARLAAQAESTARLLQNAASDSIEGLAKVTRTVQELSGGPTPPLPEIGLGQMMCWPLIADLLGSRARRIAIGLDRNSNIGARDRKTWIRQIGRRPKTVDQTSRSIFFASEFLNRSLGA